MQKNSAAHKCRHCTTSGNCAFVQVVSPSEGGRWPLFPFCIVRSSAVKVEQRQKVSEVTSLHQRYAHVRNFRVHFKRKPSNRIKQW